MLTTPLNHLLEAFDNVDEQGLLEFTVPAAFLSHIAVKGKSDTARVLIRSFFADQYLALVRLDLVKSFVNKVLIDLHRPSERYWALKIDFAKLMLLPAEDPAGELKELRRLFEEIKSLIALDPFRTATAHIYNKRNPDKKVFGHIQFAYNDVPGHSDFSLTPDPTQVANERLTKLVESSPLIRDYVRNVALALGTMGPYSSTWIGERQLYGYGQGPWMDAYRARLAQKGN